MPRHVFNSRETDFYRLCRKDTPDNDASERPELGAGQLENRDLGATLDALLDIPELEKAGFPEDLHALVQELVED
ncbi:Major intrinsic protein [Penicillium rubens]|nr:Major intrinsic protein [Penicillium rubens]